MTEAEWLAGTDPQKMLTVLKGKARPRQLRLFASACYRHIERLLQHKDSRRVVDLIELYAEGAATPEQVREAAEEVNEEWSDSWDWSPDGWVEALEGARGAAVEAAAAQYLADEQVQQGADYPIREKVWRNADAEEKRSQAAILREVFGNPFRPVAINPTCLTPQVVGLAQAAYEEREVPTGTLHPARLTVLADALEEAGCDQADLLAHLRGPGPHVRGCWAVDLLLGKS
jgi:hypothetical protein